MPRPAPPRPALTFDRYAFKPWNQPKEPTMGLQINRTAQHRTHWRKLATQHTLKAVVSHFIHEGRHIYIEPDLCGAWTVCVDVEHALFLDNLLTENVTGGARLRVVEQQAELAL